MKKLAYFSLSIFLISIFFLCFFNIVGEFKNEKTASYLRFQKINENGEEVFYWGGLHSPIQTETQERIYSFTSFDRKIIFPYGRGFECINPDSANENQIANELYKIIRDSIRSIVFNTRYDYDRANLAVRRASNPATLALGKPKLKLILYGTASPEARRYGLEKSILPGHFEVENDTLSGDRVERILSIVENKLLKDSLISELATEVRHEELQFKDSLSARNALQNPAMLDTMRFVHAFVLLTREQVKVTPVTAPVLVPIWFLLGAMALVALWGLRLPKVKRPKFTWGISAGGFLEFVRILLWCFLLSIFATLMIAFLDPTWILFFAILTCICFLVWLVWHYWDQIFAFIQLFLIALLALVAGFFRMIWEGVKQIWHFFVWIYGQIRQWWLSRTTCQKVLFFVVIYAIFATYKWLSCPC